jgi:Glycosyltransferase family 87
MGQDPTQLDGSVLLVSGPVAGAGTAAPGETTVAIPRVAPMRLRLPRVALGPSAGSIALASLIVCSLAVVAFAAAGPSVLVPQSDQVFPPWEAGPLHGLLGHVTGNATALKLGLSAVVLAMLLAYGAVLASVRRLSIRTIAICVIALHVILLMSPPLQLTDLFNYLGYARLGGLHHLNPYTNVIAQELHDPVFRLSTWHNLHSPYGPLFTALTYPLAFLPLPIAYWVLKLVTVAMSLTFIWLIWRCARMLGRDPRFAVLLVAANPIYLIYAIGGFHNDFFMLVPSIGAISLVLARRDRAAGAALMLAVAVKFSAVLLLPFLLIAVYPAQRRWRILAGAAVAALVLAAISIALFGFSLPNLVDQSTLLTDFSIPNVVGHLIGLGGGTSGLLRAANVALVLAVALLLRRRGDWLSRAGWATLALIASLAWLMPWYVIWLLPLAALGTSVRLRRAATVLTLFLLLTFVPVTGMLLNTVGYDPMGSSVGQASLALQQKLAQ